MFEDSVKSVFSFLGKNFGFAVEAISPREVHYSLGQIVIKISHSSLDEVSLRIGSLSKNHDGFFSLGVLVALESPSVGLSHRDRIASKQQDVEQALRELAQLLVVHGQRVLRADPSVLEEMQRLVDKYWADRNDSQIRQRAETAFAAKNFSEALKHYRLLGERRKPLDSKRMEMCERSCQ